MRRRDFLCSAVAWLASAFGVRPAAATRPKLTVHYRKILRYGWLNTKTRTVTWFSPRA